MDLDFVVTSFFLVIAVALAIGICLPDALYLIGLIELKRGILGGPGDFYDHDEIVTPEIAEQLAHLGFIPAGIYWEQMPAHKRFREAIFVSATKDCFAAVYRLFKNDAPRVAFKTAFQDGSFVLTQNYLGGMDINEPTLRAGGLEEVPLAEVLEEHRRRVQRFVVRGRSPMPAETIEDHVEAECTYTAHPSVQSEVGGNMKVKLGVKIAFFASGPLLMLFFGVGPAGMAAVLLSLCLMVLLVRYYGAVFERILPAEEPG